MEKVYEPKDVEERRYKQWNERGYFHAEPAPGTPKYSITIPPPNVTGSLHMGHALTYTVQDTLGRWKKMTGHTVLILPGTDHAGIATQNVVEKKLAAEGISRHDLGRDAFVEKVWEWKDEYGARIIMQLKRLGCAFDWQRERFTFDAEYVDAVLEAFVRFYEQGLIYRGNRMINWCTRCHTVISDIEVEEEEKAGHLWHIEYPFADGSGSVTVATTRPETMLGDTAVAVNPEDERYKGLVGKMLKLPLVGREIPLIADDYASLEMGTGAVKVTPAHDPHDYEAGKRNNLPQITVIGFDGKMTAEAGERYAGLDRYEARKRVVADLEEQGLLVKVEDYALRVPVCERCKTVIEPLLSDQWFMKMTGTDVVRRAMEVAERDEVTFVPERYKKIYLDWMAGLRDWPLSRQLWWGHRIPIYYRLDGTYVAAKNREEAIAKAGTDQLTQDEDVLDTWFSSALWPFATMGWPDVDNPKYKADLDYFYPTDVLTTSREIIYLWVARMIMTGLEFMGERPFDQVYIFATVLDKKGRRMSKSLGNGIDPVEMIEKYGADALRFSLLRLASKGQDIRFSEDRIPESRNFANKMWNAARFVIMNLGEGFTPAALPDASSLSLPERWIVSRLQRVAGLVNESLDSYDLDDACNALNDFLWSEYCDWFVELCKPALNGDDPAAKRNAQVILWTVLEATLRLLHPVMPYVTEEIWQALPHNGDSIMLAPYPQSDASLIDTDAEAGMGLLIESVTALRALRADFTPGGPENEAARDAILKRRFTVAIVAENETARAALQDQQGALIALARLGDVSFADAAPAAKSVPVGVAGATLYVPAEELLGGIDPAKEAARLTDEIAKLDKDIASLQGRLSNAGFVDRAAPEVVEKTRQDCEANVQRREKLVARRELLAG
jgi:valyl-tRNA synthetase